MCKGLPGSGKSTWAKQQTGAKRINKDDLRAMIDSGKWSRNNEQVILDCRDHIVRLLLDKMYNVIVDDTNLHPKHEERLRVLAKEHKAEFEIKDFTDVPIETCIKQDLMRVNSVGEAVIRKMYRQFLAPKNVEEPKWNHELNAAIICDLDGTLALFGDANPYDRDFYKDRVNEPVAAILSRLRNDAEVIIVSGRKDTFKDVTLSWLSDNKVYFNEIHMRKADDNRKDSIVKREIYEEHIKDKFNVWFVLDDRNQVVELWRSLGLTCLQVADGEF